MTAQGMTPIPADDTIPMQITDTIARGTTTPIYPVIAYPHTASGGDAIAGGFVYRGRRIPALKRQADLRGHHHRPHLVRGDGRRAQGRTTATRRRVAPMHELDAGLRPMVERDVSRLAAATRPRPCPVRRRSPARGRVDVRFAEDSDGELYLLTKTDGMIRRITGLSAP